MGCESVADVRDLDPRPVRKAMTVVGERLIYELRGVPCLDLEVVAPTRKGCAVARMFSSRVEDLATLEQAVASHATRLGEKLRREGVGTDHVTVFFHTSEHDKGSPQRSVSTLVSLPEATNDSLALVKAATWGVRRTWKSGYRYPQGGRRHGRSCAPGGLATGAYRRARPREGWRDHGRHGRLQPALGARGGSAGDGRLCASAEVVDQVRDALAPLHDAGGRSARDLGRVRGERTP
jgi:DNA polymerase V